MLRVIHQGDYTKSVSWSTGGMHSYSFNHGTTTWGRHCLVTHATLNRGEEEHDTQVRPDGTPEQTLAGGFIKDDTCLLEAKVTWRGSRWWSTMLHAVHCAARQQVWDCVLALAR